MRGVPVFISTNSNMLVKQYRYYGYNSDVQQNSLSSVSIVCKTLETSKDEDRGS